MSEHLDRLRQRTKDDVEKIDREMALLCERRTAMIAFLLNIDIVERELPAPQLAVQPPVRREPVERTPRRNLRSAVLRALTDAHASTGRGLPVDALAKGASILLDSGVTESSCRRALETLVRDGQAHSVGDMYLPGLASPIVVHSLAQEA